MRLVRPFALALALAAAPHALAAQQQQPAPQGGHGRAPHGMMMQQGRMEPFARLLEKRQELGLTAEQVTRIEAVRDRLRTQNQPLHEQMMAARRQAGLPEPAPGARGGERPRRTEEQRAAMRQMHERMRPLMEQMRTNRRTAMEEVHGILTEQQRTQLHEMHRQQRGSRPGGGHPGMRRGMQPAPAQS